MKKVALLIVLAVIAASCKKNSDGNASQPTLNVTGYIKDIHGVAQAAKIDYFLLRPENRADLQSGTMAQDSCPKHSIIAFTAPGVYNHKSGVPAGNYILVAQVSYFEKNYNWGRYSYKNISLKPGDALNEVIVFAAAGSIFAYEPWNSDK